MRCITCHPDDSQIPEMSDCVNASRWPPSCRTHPGCLQLWPGRFIGRVRTDCQRRCGRACGTRGHIGEYLPDSTAIFEFTKSGSGSRGQGWQGCGEAIQLEWIPRSKGGSLSESRKQIQGPGGSQDDVASLALLVTQGTLQESKVALTGLHPYAYE